MVDGVVGQQTADAASAASRPHSAMPAPRTPHHRQKRRPRTGERPSRTSGSGHSHHGHHASRSAARSTPHSSGQRGLERKVSFDVVAPRRSSPATASLHRHASFDPRLGARAHSSSSRERGSSRASGSDTAAWAKLVARAQGLEEALASERASRRLLAARVATEKAELLGQLSKAQEEREGMEQLWRDAKLTLQTRASEWEMERKALYQELGQLRTALRAAGAAPVPPSLPPSNLTIALRDTPEEAPTGGASTAGGESDEISTKRDELAQQASKLGSMSSAQLAASVAAISQAPAPARSFAPTETQTASSQNQKPRARQLQDPEQPRRTKSIA
jgi:hypothetical protein